MAWHDLSISSGDLETREEACLVVCIHNGSAVADVGTNRAVVWSLRAWEARGWPSKWFNGELVLCLKKRVLLLDAKPRLLVFASIEDLLGEVSEVSVSRLESSELVVSPNVCLGDDNDVVSTSERVRVVGNGFHDNF